VNSPPAVDRSPSPIDQADVEHLRVVGSFLAGNPERVRAVVASLRQASPIVESTVQGACMGESLPNGSTIRIQLEPIPRYEAGEIVGVLDGTKLFVHRLVYVGRRGHVAGVVVTRSDAKLLPDPPCRAASVLGKVIGVEVHGRWTAPPGPARGPAHRRALAWAILCVVTSLAHVHVGLADRALKVLCHGRNGLARVRRPLRTRRPTPPTV
jgi:hypothetical protein